jgi:hypothetical protein
MRRACNIINAQQTVCWMAVRVIFISRFEQKKSGYERSQRGRSEVFRRRLVRRDFELDAAMSRALRDWLANGRPSQPLSWNSPAISDLTGKICRNASTLTAIGACSRAWISARNIRPDPPSAVSRAYTYRVRFRSPTPPHSVRHPDAAPEFRDRYRASGKRSSLTTLATSSALSLLCANWYKPASPRIFRASELTACKRPDGPTGKPMLRSLRTSPAYTSPYRRDTWRLARTRQ